MYLDILHKCRTYRVVVDKIYLPYIYIIQKYIKSKHYKSWQEPYLQITADAYSNSPELIGTSTVDDYEPGSKTFDPWPNSELGDPLKTMFITSDFGPRTINGTPDDHGGIDLVIERKYLNSTVGTLLNVLLKKAGAQAKQESNVTVNKSLQAAS